jgi:hypothetical protein
VSLINLETPSPGGKAYSYRNDSWLNRDLGEPVGFDWGGAIRVRTWRWRWQRFCNFWRCGW